ncbi:hypothetical protein EON62_04885 [archaeon]|nr:MAG: hypothetical protein EON62_04885 [archaeon]
MKTCSTSAASVKAHGRYMYVELRAVSNTGKHTMRRQPWLHYSFAVDIANKKHYIYRVVFSTEFVAEGELRLGKIAHVQLPK